MSFRYLKGQGAKKIHVTLAAVYHHQRVKTRAHTNQTSVVKQTGAKNPKMAVYRTRRCHLCFNALRCIVVLYTQYFLPSFSRPIVRSCSKFVAPDNPNVINALVRGDDAYTLNRRMVSTGEARTPIYEFGREKSFNECETQSLSFVTSAGILWTRKGSDMASRTFHIFSFLCAEATRRAPDRFRPLGDLQMASKS